MPRRRRPPGDYHLLVAQNFLSNISLNGTHNDTKLRIFNRPGVENSQPEYGEAVQSTSVTQVRSEREERRRPPHPTPKRSLLHRFTRIVSSDDFAYGDEEVRGRDGRKAEMIILEDRPSSPLSTSHNLTFLKRLRYTLAKGESQERLRHLSGCSTEELRPFEFKEGEELTFGHMFDESRERAFTLGSDGSPAICRKERRGSLVVGSLLNAATAAAGLVSRSSSCEPGMETSVGELGEAAVRLEYDPSILSEIASVQHSVVRFTSYSCALCSFATEDEQKRSVNEKFRSKFPNIHLTYSKFRSLKLELLSMALECNIDMSTLALAFVYFEKVVLKGLISKSNRKLVAGACFLVAIKVTDIGAVKLKQLISYVEDKLRVDARELLALEIPLCVALHFDLNPPLPQLKPHYDRLVFGTV